MHNRFEFGFKHLRLLLERYIVIYIIFLEFSFGSFESDKIPRKFFFTKREAFLEKRWLFFFEKHEKQITKTCHVTMKRERETMYTHINKKYSTTIYTNVKIQLIILRKRHVCALSENYVE